MVGSNIQEKGEVKNFGHKWEEPSPVPPLVANPDLPIKNTLSGVLDLITVIILKRMREIIFFQCNKVIAC